MVKVVFGARKRPDLSLDEFRGYWLTEHAALGRQIPGLRRYVISFPVAGQPSIPPYDGLAELWFDDLAAVERRYGTAEMQAGLADLPHFLDMDTWFRMVVEEHVIVA